MDELINSISDAYEKYINAANAVLDAYHFAGGRRTEATNRALEKLTEQKQHLLSACDNAEGSINAIVQQVGELEVAHHIEIEALEPVMKNLYRVHRLLMLFSCSCKTLTSCFNLMTYQVRTLEAATLTNAAEVASVRLANAERRQPNAPDGGENGSHVTGECIIAVSPVLTTIDLNRATQRQSSPARLNHTRVLSELDPKKTA